MDGDQDQNRQDEKEMSNGDQDNQTTPAGQVTNGPADLMDELERERAKAAEYLDQAQRARAELLNYKRRTEQEMQQFRRSASEHLITRLLPVVDDFNRAVESVPDEKLENSWIQGFLLIQRKLWSILEAEGVRPIESVGQPFDPTIHEAVTFDSDGEGVDIVISEFQRGYTLNDRIIRPAMVQVGRISNSTDKS